MPKLSVLLGLALCAGALAQAPVGSIAGVVKDPTGAAVAGAVVTSTSLADAGKRRVISDDQGFFLIPTLMPGVYKLVIEAKGFRNYEVQRVGVAGGRADRVGANLTVWPHARPPELAGGAVGSAP